MRTITLYRDDSTTQVIFGNVKHFFWTSGNTVLAIAQYTDTKTGAHRYIHWPRERFCWFKDEPSGAYDQGPCEECGTTWKADEPLPCPQCTAESETARGATNSGRTGSAYESRSVVIRHEPDCEWRDDDKGCTCGARDASLT